MLLGRGWLHRVMKRPGLDHPEAWAISVLPSTTPPCCVSKAVGWDVCRSRLWPGPLGDHDPGGSYSVPKTRMFGFGWLMPLARKSSWVHFAFWGCLVLRR
jgi:hypothetical protein